MPYTNLYGSPSSLSSCDGVHHALVLLNVSQTKMEKKCSNNEESMDIGAFEHTVHGVVV